MTFDPTPSIRWMRRISIKNGDAEFVNVLQVGYRPINGGAIVWNDVPVVFDSNADTARAPAAGGEEKP